MRHILALLILCLAAIQPGAARAGSESIAIVVNEDAITHSDIEDRLHLIMASSGMPNSPEIKQKLLPQVVSGMIDEQIRLQEAKKKGVEVSQAEIDSSFAELAAQNKLKPEQFKEVMKRGGLRVESLQAQIRAHLAWVKLVQKELRPKITVSESDIESKMALMRGNIGKNEYLVAEIFLPVDDIKKEADAGQLAAQLVRDIRAKKAPFFKLAQQFSQSAGAAQGGDLGWVQQGQLAQELDAVLPAIGPGNISEPVRSLSGYHILMVREQRQIAEQNMPDRDKVMNMIGQERLERQARRYHMDLKAAAYIDNRLAS